VELREDRGFIVDGAIGKFENRSHSDLVTARHLNDISRRQHVPVFCKHLEEGVNGALAMVNGYGRRYSNRSADAQACGDE
jgi:hypothetical protein